MSVETYIRNPDVALREEDESGSLLFNPDTGEVLVINGTGRFIWDRCEKETSIDEIVDALEDVYDGVPESVREEVDSFVSVMIAGGFLGSK